MTTEQCKCGHPMSRHSRQYSGCAECTCTREPEVSASDLVTILRETAAIKPFTPQTFGQARVSMREAADEIERLKASRAEYMDICEKLSRDLAHKDAYYAQFHLTPKNAEELASDRI